ncbi:MarR family winged helix-turn-helix transcriptional regulator [Amycolatopsis cynarae]|uniref:Winged helix-turn-helix transcriptional regulator n=2 Tax=Amycolatopsis TaxID=1813 RepID=A0A558AAW6_9PSEU|nr:MULTISPECIES: MarR family winged helix-turn-helix transcriptional regulator [Amycolatopsis]TVT21392.1 winged helix-turn-helix transcriptional regulator [Amycolatopsis rhizosphaerae]WAL64568.1 MarR family winged helix-turn-helix transcriptional regulator [Amycolatopsis sp. HUAS 11-8]
MTADELDFWSFVELANTRLAGEFGFRHQLATEVLLTLNRASNIVTYDLEASVHRPRGRSWSGFRLLFVTWLAGPLEAKKAAELTGMSRAAVSNLTKTLVAEGMLERAPGEHDGRSVLLSLTERGRREMLEVFRAQNEREHEWASVLTETEQRILIMLLDKLITNRTQFDVRGRN